MATFRTSERREREMNSLEERLFEAATLNGLPRADILLVVAKVVERIKAIPLATAKPCPPPTWKELGYDKPQTVADLKKKYGWK